MRTLAVTHPARPRGFAWGSPAPAPTVGREGTAGSPQQLGRLFSEGGWRSCSGCFRVLRSVPAGSLQFKAGGGTSWAGEEEAVGASMQKASPLGAVPWSKRSLFVPSCSFPAALPTHRAQQPWHGHPAVAAGTDGRVCRSPFALARRPNTSLQGSRHEVSRAGSTLCPQTSRARTAAEPQAAAEQTNPVIQPRGHL